MTKAIEAQIRRADIHLNPKATEDAVLQKPGTERYGEKLTILPRSNPMTLLEIGTITSFVLKNPTALKPLEKSNVTCADGSCPMSACRLPATNDNANTCKGPNCG